MRTNVIVETKNISKPESQTQLFKKPSSNCYKRSSLRGSCCGTVVIAVRGAHFGAVAVAVLVNKHHNQEVVGSNLAGAGFFSSQ